MSRYFVDVDMMQEVQHYFDFDYEMIPEGEYGEEALSKRLNEKDKYLQALKVYLANANFYYKVQKGVVIGIPEHTGENTDKIAGISSGGIDLWIYDVEVDYTNTKGETYIPNVFTRCGASQVGVDLCRNRMVSASNNGNVLIYSLDKNTTLSGLYYAKGNECLENYTNYRDGFGGILKIWNVKKENYEVLALRLGEALVEHPQDYVNEKGQIKFMVDEVDDGEYFPIISAIVKEVQ